MTSRTRRSGRRSSNRLALRFVEVRMGRFACVEVRMGRFARVGCPRCGATGMHLARLRTCALNPAWTAGFRGRSLKFVRAAFAGRARRLRRCADMPSTSRCCVSPSTRPPHRRFTQAVGTNSVPHLCCLIWAASGRRGRDVARGRHQHAPPGLTRIARRRAGVPSRLPPVILRAVAGSTLADIAASGVDSATARGIDRTAESCRSSITTRNARAPTRDSRQARWRVSRPAAGCVAASMARRSPDPLKSWRKHLSQPPG